MDKPDNISKELMKGLNNDEIQECYECSKYVIDMRITLDPRFCLSTVEHRDFVFSNEVLFKLFFEVNEVINNNTKLDDLITEASENSESDNDV